MLSNNSYPSYSDEPTPAGREATRFRPPPSLQSRTSRTRSEDPTSPIQRISLELSRVCNLRCTYCYAGASAEHQEGLTDDEVRAIIDESITAGACAISIVAGGESLLRPSLLVDGESAIDYANDRGCYCYIYTNCTLMNVRGARWLFERDISVVGKLNSLRAEVQDELAGVSGAFQRIRRGIDALLEAGFGGNPPYRLALETIICRQNYDELPELWRWMRHRGIIPEVEIPTLHGRAADNRHALYFDEDEAPDKYRELFEELLSIDRAEFGFDWIPHPPFPASSCRLYDTNCYINDRGGVQPCAGVELEVGVLPVGARKNEGKPLAEILTDPLFPRLRRINQALKGVCKDCDLAHTCYGCRAAAWHKTGDLFAEDPVCWRRKTGSAVR